MKATQQSLLTLQNQEHPDCFGCGTQNDSGLALDFHLRPDDGVEAEFECRRCYQGYPEFLHGGIASLLLDAAMTNCLFARQIRAVTARLIVRYILPVKVDRRVKIRAWVREYEPPLFVLEAELEQDGKVAVRGSAKFINRDL